MEINFAVEAKKDFHIATLVEEFPSETKTFGNELLLEENPKTGHGKEDGKRRKNCRNTVKTMLLEFTLKSQFN